MFIDLEDKKGNLVFVNVALLICIQKHDHTDTYGPASIIWLNAKTGTFSVIVKGEPKDVAGKMSDAINRMMRQQQLTAGVPR